jgi:hypothetical protein
MVEAYINVSIVCGLYYEMRQHLIVEEINICEAMSEIFGTSKFVQSSRLTGD